jgi:signal transduction histidine kinase
MTTPPVLNDEEGRNKALKKYHLLDTMPEEQYDSITRVIAAICDAPVALIALVDKDRNFMKSAYGVETREAPRESALCSHAISNQVNLTIIPEADKDARFQNDPIIYKDGMSFYAAAALTDDQGYRLGTLCIFDNKPRELNATQLKALESMADHVMVLFEERYQKIQLQLIKQRLNDQNVELKSFAGIISHDLKTPLSNLLMIADILARENQDQLNEESKEYLNHLKTTGYNLADYIDSIVRYYRSDELEVDNFETIQLKKLIDEVVDLGVTQDDVDITYSDGIDRSIYSNSAALKQILLNLITNSVKYGDKPQTRIHISLEEFSEKYQIAVADNGRGIASDKLEDVLKLFYVADDEDREGNRGSGIGLATTKRLVEKLNGSIEIKSELHKGTTVTLTLPKKLS